MSASSTGQRVSATIFNRTIVSTARSAGVDTDRLLERLAADHGRLADPDAWLPSQLVERFLDLLGSTLGESAPGLWMGQQVDPESVDVLGYAMRTAPTLRRAYETAARYYGLVGTGVEVYFHERDGRSLFTYLVAPELANAHRHRSEMTMATLVTLGRKITGRSWPPEFVTFQQEAPNDTTPHHDLFGPRVDFGKPTMELAIGAEIANLPCRTADQTLHEILERYARSLVQEDPDHPSLVRELRLAIVQAIPAGDVSLDATARALGMSRRTLQRRLRELGTSHQKLVRQTRRYLAEGYLRSADISIDEVAFLLGYANTPAFARAFKQWTGMPPGGFRAREVGAKG